MNNYLDYWKKKILEDLKEMEKSKKMSVGTIRSWQGKKYRKVSEKKWELVKEGQGNQESNNEIGRKVEQAISVEGLLNIVKRNKDKLFNNGRPKKNTGLFLAWTKAKYQNILKEKPSYQLDIDGYFTKKNINFDYAERKKPNHGTLVADYIQELVQANEQKKEIPSKIKIEFPEIFTKKNTTATNENHGGDYKLFVEQVVHNSIKSGLNEKQLYSVTNTILNRWM